MIRQKLAIILLCVLPLSAVALALYSLENYHNTVHNDASFYVCLYCVAAFVVSTVVWRYAKKHNRGASVLWCISAAVLGFVFYVGSKIPFCVVCDRITAEDLGFLTHWIQPENIAH